MEPYRYFLRNDTRSGLLAELKAKGFEFGGFDENGDFAEHIPDMYEQASVRPFGTTAIYLEKCPVNGVPSSTKWHVNVASPVAIEWNGIEVLTNIQTPYNIV